MARYQGQVSVFRASLPLGAEVKDLPPPKNFIDELVFQQLKTLGIPPSAICDDSTFLRRISCDLTGRLPTAEDAEQFLADTDPAKREKWIDKLLESEAYADFFANKWSSILRNKRQQESSPTARTCFTIGFARPCTRTSLTTSSSARFSLRRAR